PLTDQGRDQLLELPHQHALAVSTRRLFAGEVVNPSENQPALHMALRADQPEEFPAAGGQVDVASERDRFLDVAERLHSGAAGLTDLLHIGIGGSDLGPRLVADALGRNDGAVRVHWLSTLDGRRFRRLVQGLDPARTGVVIASKSFSTEESLTQAIGVRDWLGKYFENQAWAATANPDKARAFGIRGSGVLAFPAWTGGRFSLWSSVGVSAAASIGREGFQELLAGAHQADRDFSNNPDPSSLAVVVGLIVHYLRRDLELPTLGVVSYEPRLRLLGDYLQQLVMESLGKGVDLDHRALDQPTTPLIFGGRGTDLQHSIFQALHQGPDTHPLLLVGSLSDSCAPAGWHRTQLAHLLAQATAFAKGSSRGETFKHLPGNRAVALLLTEAITPERLGYLLATFEHAVFALSVLWNINPFDQWGVEEGKRLAATFRQADSDPDRSLDQWLDLAARAMTDQQ
ncbi:MAG: hypothetical protein ACNA7J_14245, partial [Wenzhouxiangella sp.]